MIFYPFSNPPFDRFHPELLRSLRKFLITPLLPEENHPLCRAKGFNHSRTFSANRLSIWEK
jgi:hypothetical protein